MEAKERLEKDYKRMEKLSRKSSLISFQCTSPLRDEYEVSFTCKGIVLKGDKPEVLDKHLVKIKLGVNYPFEPPRLECVVPIFHPNVNSETGEICIQGAPWDSTRHLDDVCIQIGEMIQYKNFNVSNRWNKDAAVYAIKNWNVLSQLDPRPFLDRDNNNS
jgi:ubiquitin-protein ligase